MKSIAVYILAIIFLSAVALGLSYQVKLPEGAQEMQVYSLTTPPVGKCEQVDMMTNFNIYHYYDKFVSIKDSKLDNTLGVAYVYPKDSMSEQLLMKKLSIDVKFTQDLEDGVTYYGKSRAGSRSVYIDGQEINVQIVNNKNYIIVGFPLIMGSY
ncbi:MAG: hypothetical protein K2I46_01800 [Clostridia bacterium]|nr:hypothetical protein [Clostridia bacterium]